MKSAHLRIAIPAAALIGFAAAPALAQRPLSPQERVLFLEQQVRASQAAATRLEQRLGAIERLLQQLINQGEVSGHKVSVLETEVDKLRTDINKRLNALETRPVMAEAMEPESEEPASVPSKPKLQTAAASIPELPSNPPSGESADDAGEEAYSVGFRLWRAGKYDQAVNALRAFTSAFPNHRRVSFANNLIGRALLDDGKPRPAAEALLANYRADPKGERAPDSLYYLGQALMRLDQPSQACKAYAELEDVYSGAVRPDLQSLVNKGKSEARCS